MQFTSEAKRVSRRLRCSGRFLVRLRRSQDQTNDFWFRRDNTGLEHHKDTSHHVGRRCGLCQPIDGRGIQKRNDFAFVGKFSGTHVILRGPHRKAALSDDPLSEFAVTQMELCIAKSFPDSDDGFGRGPRMTAHLLSESRQVPVGRLFLGAERKAVERDDIGGVRRGHVFHCLLGWVVRRLEPCRSVWGIVPIQIGDCVKCGIIEQGDDHAFRPPAWMACAELTKDAKAIDVRRVGMKLVPKFVKLRAPCLGINVRQRVKWLCQEESLDVGIAMRGFKQSADESDDIGFAFEFIRMNMLM
jgi:hypothetical protein